MARDSVTPAALCRLSRGADSPKILAFGEVRGEWRDGQAASTGSTCGPGT
jgi:hypothetical protein